MKYVYPVLLILFFAFACHNKEEEKTEGLSYEVKTFRVESKEGCQSDTLKCASYEVEYPVFNALSKVVKDSLTRQIMQSIDAGNPEVETHTLEAAGKLFIAEFEKAQAEFPENTMGWYFKGVVKVSLITDTLISLKSSAEFFTGGAHGGYGTYFINIRPSTGETVKLDDIFKPGYKENLSAIGEKEFRESLNLVDTISLAEEGFEFPNDKFALNDNYGLTKEGIVFVFNIYEIAPYVLVAQEVLIPYEKITNLMRQ
jgi:hypothetical protein